MGRKAYCLPHGATLQVELPSHQHGSSFEYECYEHALDYVHDYKKYDAWSGIFIK